MKKTFILGLTGPTGAGKTTACRVFGELGFFHIDCDRTARAVTEPGSPLLPLLAEAFGEDILRPDGSLDRAKTASRAFASREGTETLNRLSFPFITKRIEEEIAAASRTCGRILLDAPTLFESGADRLCDRCVAVLAEREERLRRIRARDGLTAEQAATRISAGKPDAFYRARCDYIIRNSGSEADFLKNIRRSAVIIVKERKEVTP